ncbi:sulfite exporter TauE/SafE family protein [Fimbriiglobus ruber]|uniref:Probable membrane transporter protein n=1 Tax=Fimbriiglobus ruber TaxID=1908690 RepID=A0A225E243_9BACT|nr:sulfite exporter TauE/SafE family protein [Fimbriiglobus ruber]OWK43559.1 putative membrane protein [Fimbriiglobus ruber]
MPDDIPTYLILGISAFAAGVMNSVAGGGTLLTFPALIAALAPDFGLGAAAVANATSTTALLPGSFAGAIGYRKELAGSRRFLLRMIGPSVIGGALGAWLVVQDEQAFGVLVPWLVLTAAVLFLVQQPLSRWMKTHRPDHEPGPVMVAALIGFQFLVALYGGYFGAGIGILMLAALGFMGAGNIHQMNGIKTCLAATINGASVVVFVAYQLVHWRYAAVMVMTAILGGYFGARIARRVPATLMRWVVIAIAFALAAYYFAKQAAG